jgi:hypothetical protein
LNPYISFFFGAVSLKVRETLGAVNLNSLRLHHHQPRDAFGPGRFAMLQFNPFRAIRDERRPPVWAREIASAIAANREMVLRMVLPSGGYHSGPSQATEDCTD